MSAHKRRQEKIIEIEVASDLKLKEPKSPGEQSVDCIPYEIRNHQLLKLSPDVFQHLISGFRLEEITRDEHEYHHVIGIIRQKRTFTQDIPVDMPQDNQKHS